MDYKNYINENKVDVTKDDIVFELCNLITEARLHAGISQAELAKRIGTHQPSIARAERGEVVPGIEFLYRIAKAVGASLILPRFNFMDESITATVNSLDSNIPGDSIPSPVSYFISERLTTSSSVHTIV